MKNAVQIISKIPFKENILLPYQFAVNHLTETMLVTMPKAIIYNYK